MMKKLSIVLLLAGAAFSLQAQEAEPNKKKQDWSKVNLSNRPKDHLMFQVGMHSWTQRPDTFATKGLSRSFNAYFMFDFVFKTDPRFSVGLGVGVGTDRISFDNEAGRDLNIINGNGITFRRNTGADSTIRYRSIGLHSAFLEAPVEIRFMTKPETPNKSWKFALGMKVGTMVSAVDKTRFERDAAGNLQYNTKVKDRKNFNNLRLAAQARVGYGNIGLFAQYQINDFIKEGQGPSQVRPFSVGLTVTGL